MKNNHLKRISVGYSGDAYSLPTRKVLIGDVRWKACMHVYYGRWTV